MMRKLLSICFCMILAPVLQTAHAASPIGNVGTAKADKGAFSTEFRTGFTFDDSGSSNDERFRLRQHIDYGFSDWYAARIVIEQDKQQSADFDFRSVTFENRFQFFESDTHGWDGGVRVNYGVSAGGGQSDEIDIRFIANVPIGENWEWRHNTVLEYELGGNADDGLNLELRNQLTKVVGNFIPGTNKTRVGIEMFNDFGNLRDDAGFSAQDHQIGPVMKAYFPKGVYIQAGYRAGLSDDAPDHLLKFFVGRNF